MVQLRSLAATALCSRKPDSCSYLACWVLPFRIIPCILCLVLSGSDGRKSCQQHCLLLLRLFHQPLHRILRTPFFHRLHWGTAFRWEMGWRIQGRTLTDPCRWRSRALTWRVQSLKQATCVHVRKRPFLGCYTCLVVWIGCLVWKATGSWPATKASNLNGTTFIFQSLVSLRSVGSCRESCSGDIG